MRRPLLTSVLLFFLLSSSLSAQMSAGDKDVYFNLWRDPAYHGYAAPAATFFGTLLNSGWYRTVAIEQDFEWNVGVVMPWALRAEADKTFKVNGVELPTLVGDDDPINAIGAPISPIHGAASVLFGLFLPTLDAHFSYFHTALDFRLMYLPTFSISRADYGIAWFGIGLRHDVGHYFNNHSLPIDIALSWHGTWWGLDYGERKDWRGTHYLDGFAHMTSLLIGKRFDKYEVFGEIGWEGSSMKASGSMSKPTWGIPEFETKGSVDGRNGFRVGVNLSLHFGSTSGLGLHYGSQIGGWFRLFSIPKVTLHPEKSSSKELVLEKAPANSDVSPAKRIEVEPSEENATSRSLSDGNVEEESGSSSLWD